MVEIYSKLIEIVNIVWITLTFIFIEQNDDVNVLFNPPYYLIEIG